MTMSETAAQPSGQLHEVLLRMAGRIPDDLLSEARTWLAAGQYTDVAQAVALGCVAGEVSVDPADIDVLAAVLTAGGAEPDILDDLPGNRGGQVPECTLAPLPAHTVAECGDAAPACLDLTGAYPTRWGPDERDAAVIEAVAAIGTRTRLVGVWRAWRSPVSAGSAPSPRRVYLVEAGAEVSSLRLPAVTAAVQAALGAAGEHDPQVEVVTAGGAEPAYQRWVRGSGALLWAATPTAPLRIARVFDRVDPQAGPSFDRDHPCLDDAERAMALGYLAAGEAVLVSGVLLPDVVDPARGEAVPVTLRTDGTWVWADTTGYYLERYGIAPDPGLLDHMRGRGFAAPEATSVAVHLAMVALSSGHDEPVWTV